MSVSHTVDTLGGGGAVIAGDRPLHQLNSRRSLKTAGTAVNQSTRGAARAGGLSSHTKAGRPPSTAAASPATNQPRRARRLKRPHSVARWRASRGITGQRWPPLSTPVAPGRRGHKPSPPPRSKKRVPPAVSPPPKVPSPLTTSGSFTAVAPVAVAASARCGPLLLLLLPLAVAAAPPPHPPRGCCRCRCCCYCRCRCRCHFLLLLILSQLLLPLDPRQAGLPVGCCQRLVASGSQSSSSSFKPARCLDRAPNNGFFIRFFETDGP